MFRALALTVLLTVPAHADEAWDSDVGEIVYMDQIVGAALFTVESLDGYPALLVIPGLAGNYTDRGVHDAFWIGIGPGECMAVLSFDGEASNLWGSARVEFDRPAYPTGFTLSVGDCFGPQDRSFRATAR